MISGIVHLTNLLKLMFFQDIIQNLNKFWSEEGCLIMQPYDTEKGQEL